MIRVGICIVSHHADVGHNKGDTFTSVTRWLFGLSAECAQFVDDVFSWALTPLDGYRPVISANRDGAHITPAAYARVNTADSARSWSMCGVAVLEVTGEGLSGQ